MSGRRSQSKVNLTQSSDFMLRDHSTLFLNCNQTDTLI
jgi:hypothetical protein